MQLDPELIKLILRRYKKITDVQLKSIPVILSGKNVIISSPTGTGKTEAALWPILTLMKRQDTRPISLVYITPLRALNRDLEERIRFWAEVMGYRAEVRHGDTNQIVRRKQAISPPDILITTPETVQILLIGKNLRKYLENLKYVVIDEVHELIDDKRGAQLSLVLSRMRRISGKFQTILLSATISNSSEAARLFLGDDDFEIVEAHAARELDIKVEFPDVKEEDYNASSELLIDPDIASKLRRISEIIEGSKSVLIFTNTRSMAEALTNKLRSYLKDKKAISIHHSSLSRESREQTEKEFKEGALNAVIATSSLELGIDVGYVDTVIQFSSPRQTTRLIQRVGRASHKPDEPARGFIIAQDSDDYLESLIIVKRAKNQELEGGKIFRRPLDVLAHQIEGELLVRGRMSIRELLNLFRSSYLYKNLNEEDLERLLLFMNEIGLLYYDKESKVASVSRYRAYEYYFSNLSTIPDVRTVPVIDDSSGFFLGSLDEMFVAEYLKPGVKFVFRGAVWQVKEVESGRVYVRAAADPSGAIPSWIGEELPVTFETAMSVGKLRERVGEMIRNGMNEDRIIEDLLKEFPFTQKEDLIRGIDPIIRHMNLGYPLPTDKRIVIEETPGIVIVHATLGTLINRTLSRIIAYFLAKRYGLVVRTDEDPYRIFIIGASGDLIRHYLVQIIQEGLENYLEAIRETGFYRIRLVHVAKRFGAIKRDADITGISIRKLVDAYRGTVIDEETLNEVLTVDLDIDGLRKIFNLIRSGEIKIDYFRSKELSPIAAEGVRRSPYYLEFAPSSFIEKKMLETFKIRLMRTQLLLLCSSCWQWSSWISISSLLELKDLRCPKCHSSRLAGLHGKDSQLALEYIKRSIERGRPFVPDSRLANKVFELGKLTEEFGIIALISMGIKGYRIEDLRNLLAENREFDKNFLSRLALIEKESIKKRLKD
ncbi:MAG: DEAD/DEAH box helicase [Candidatus Methanodesulfokora sp.]